jgi:hypothetical protein
MSYKQWLSEWKKLAKTKVKVNLYPGFKSILPQDYEDGLSPTESLNSCLSGKGPGFDSLRCLEHIIESIGSKVPTVVTSFGIRAGL